jgi:hypothetical protein
MTTAPKTPLNYRPPTATPAQSGWRIVGQLFGGFVLGIIAGIAIAAGVGLLFPNASRAEVGYAAGYIFVGGLTLAACSIPALIFRRWFLAGLFAGIGALTAFWGFVIAVMSGINC